MHTSKSSILALALPFLALAHPLTKRAPAGPVVSVDFPDPSVTKIGDTYYAFATNSGGKNAQVATSQDFVSWQYLDLDALPTLGSWVNPDKTDVWAPAVSQRDDGSFIMYYSALATPNLHCIGAATSNSITGPYTDTSPNALICPLDAGGAIDASGFRDSNGQRYILYKVDANAIGNGGTCGNTVEPILDTPIVLQPVQEDGITFSGDASTILHREDRDGPLVEAPSLALLSDGRYALFFSSNCYTTPEYDVGYAFSTSGVGGPYVRGSEPLLKTGSYGLTAPGGASAIEDAGGLRIAFHANLGSGRSMWTAGLNVNGDSIYIA